MIAMLSLAIPLAFLPYLVAMGFLAVSWLVTYFGIRETIPAHLPPQMRYHPFLPLGELRHPRTRKVATIASAAMIASAVTEMFHALFVLETLGLSFRELGWSASAGLLVNFVFPYPIGWIVDRLGPQTVLLAGFLLMIGVELAFIFWVHDLLSLTLVVILYRAARLVIRVPILPVMFQHTTPESRGSIFAGVQMTRAALASAATLVTGYLASVSGSYRMCYVIAAAACVAGFVAVIRLRGR